jgi:serine protease
VNPSPSRTAPARGLFLVALALAGIARPAGQTLEPFTLLLDAGRAEALLAAWNDRRPYVPGDVLVRFRDRTSTDQRLRSLRSVRGGMDVSTGTWLRDVLWVSASREDDAEAVAAVLRQQPEVLWAQPNYVRRLAMTPNDPGYGRQWNLDLINVPRAWDINDGASPRVVVAVIDSGVSTVTDTYDLKLWTGQQFETAAVPFRVNPDIAPERVGAGRDFVFWNGPVVDMVGHGTHVAGTILQETNNGLGLAGIAHHAMLMPLKVCVGFWELQFAMAARSTPGYVRPDDAGGCPDSAIAQAISYAADHGAHVINISLGGPYPAPVVLEALQYAVSRGVFVAIAVGNEYTEGNPVSFPARYAADIDGVVAVTAVGPSSRRAFYANTGPYVEVAAPGGDTRAGGAAGAIYQASLNADDFAPLRVARPRFDRYAEVPSQGTSMAAPHVAGVAALLHAQGLTTPAAIERAITAFARDLGAPGRDDEYGHGLVDAPSALRGRGVGVSR